MKKELDGVGKAGAIINIVASSFLILYGLFFIGMGLLASFADDEIFTFIFFSIIGLLMMLINIFTLIFNIQVVSNQLEKKIVAVVFGFLSGSFLGAILLLVGKEEIKNTSQPIIYRETPLLETLQSYKSLLDRGVITEDEFKQLKQDLIHKNECL